MFIVNETIKTIAAIATIATIANQVSFIVYTSNYN